MLKKRFILPVTVFALMLSMGLAACNSNANNNESKEEPASQQTSGGGNQSQGASSAAQSKITITAADKKTKLIIDETVQLSADVEGVTWSSNKPEVATVSETGLVTAVGKGSASIKANKTGYKEGSISISVDLQKITITIEGEKNLIVGETAKLSADKEGVVWVSTNPAVATVDANGLVTAISKGNAKITASKDKHNDASVDFVVDNPSITVSAADNKVSLLKTETVQLTASEQGVTWSSSNAEIASVSESGLVTAVAYGTATISAAKEGFNAGTIDISVVRPAPTATLHMENADHYSSDGVWGTNYSGTMYGPGEESPVYQRSSGNASEGTCIAYMDNGDTESLTFTSSAAVKAELVMTMASRSAVSDMSTVMEVKFNKVAIDLAGKSFEGGGDTNTFVEFSFGMVDLVAGNNVLDFAFLGSSPYMDDLNIYAEAATEIAIVMPVEKDPVTVNETSITVAEGKSAQITSSLEGLSYKSANEAIATVSETGLVTGVAAGSTTISISKDGYKTIKIPVEVVEAEGAFKVNIDNITGEGVVTKESRNLTAPDNVMIDTFAVGAVGTLEFNVEKAGTYSMYMKARASGGYNATEADNLATCMELTVNGVKLDLTGEVAPASFNTYLLGDVTLTAGKNTIVITCITSVPGINLFNFIPKA